MTKSDKCHIHAIHIGRKKMELFPTDVVPRCTLTCFLSWFMGRRIVTMIKIVIVEVFVVIIVVVIFKFAIVDRTVDEWSRRSRMWMVLLY